jgi:hypothetical protein
MKGISEMSNWSYPIEALMENYGFSPENVNEALAKTVNDIYYRTYGQGVDTLDANDIALLEGIIHICPQAGGNAVYSARALYRTINDTTVYNDSLICGNAGYFRDIQDEWAQKENVKTDQESLIVYLYPNPASQHLTLLFSTETQGEIRISDAMGRLIWHGHVKQSSKQKLIDVGDFPSGLYFLSFNNSRLFSTMKFIKQ